jgi:peptidoglycan glycosyltransferase
MNRQIRLVGVGIMVLFVALFLQLNWLQVVHASAIDNNPLNGRAVTQEFDKPRGQIVSFDGQALARSVPTPKGAFAYQRQYPMGSLFAAITGFFSFTYGADGLEKTYNSVLTGGSASSSLPTSITGLRNLLTQKNPTDNVVISVSTAVQQAAETALAGRTGSVVAIEPATGAVVAMYSNPSYNPGLLSQSSQPRVTAAYHALVAAPGNPLSPGAYRNSWPPGSTFKIITSSAVFDHDPSLASKAYPVLSALPLPQTTALLHNFAGETCGGMLLSLFTVSCDTGFGAIGLDLGASSLAAEASAFGFDKVPPLDEPAVAAANFPPVSSFAQAPSTVAFSAIGQENVSATPLEMALAAAGIADNGTIMTPHLLDHITDSQGATTATYNPKPWLQATSQATAASVTGLMLSVTQNPGGTGAAVDLPGVSLAAKTGTAQTGTHHTDEWFAVFGPVPNPTIAVAVVVPDQPDGNQDQGGTIAAPVARAVIAAWLASPQGKAAQAVHSGPGVTSRAPSLSSAAG